ncbi:hypothetical protein TIFTF001_029449 [Ficus carica]|uniref:Transposase MuDR plant domain-containing protein n=1 Tax=Ficus carica TaxID=3494 RepID=A0AA88DRS8_FICCA|nr:hypothetical protein TIFTF001_029449 [Ficus carica]
MQMKVKDDSNGTTVICSERPCEKMMVVSSRSDSSCNFLWLDVICKTKVEDDSDGTTIICSERPCEKVMVVPGRSDSSCMSQFYILVEYNGKWENVDGGFWKWFGVGMSKGFVVDRSINFFELEETTYDKTSINQSNYEHPLQICVISTPINERITGFNPTPITGSNPTPEETVHEEVANEDDGVDKAGDDVPEGGDEVRKGCDGVPEEDDGVPEGGDGLHERVYESRCQHFESEEARFVPLISSDSGRNDGSDLMVGKHFDSKEELNTKLDLVAINGMFEMKVKKSTKSLKEVVCVDEPNCLWQV